MSILVQFMSINIHRITFSLYPRIFEEEMRYANPSITGAELEVAYDNDFPSWFSLYVRCDIFILNIHLLD